MQKILSLLIKQIATSFYRVSELIRGYEGVPDFPAFESYRNELLPPCEPELF
jgi:hypothetical protein